MYVFKYNIYISCTINMLHCIYIYIYIYIRICIYIYIYILPAMYLHFFKKMYLLTILDSAYPQLCEYTWSS